MTMLPHKSLFGILERAYRCPRLDDDCQGMSWNPDQGDLPRGFFGATGTPGEVRLVLILQGPPELGLEPGPELSPIARTRQIAERFALALERRENATFGNLRTILDCCLPGQSLEQQSRLAWITAAALCSPSEADALPTREALGACRRGYLLPQLQLFPRATVVALGQLAHRTLEGFVEHQTVGDPEYPACSRPGARESWLDLGRRLNG